MICLCSEEREAVVESRAACSLALRSSTAHRECPRVPPERPIPAMVVERDSPIITGRKAAPRVLG